MYQDTGFINSDIHTNNEQYNNFNVTPQIPSHMDKKYISFESFHTLSLSAQLKILNLEEIKIIGDGNCQFRAIAYIINTIYNLDNKMSINNDDTISYRTIRKDAIHHIQQHKNNIV